MNALQEFLFLLLLLFLKAGCFAQTQFKLDCPQCCLLLKLPALWIPSVWRECPLHFFYTVTQARSQDFLAFIHKHTGLLGARRNTLRVPRACTNGARTHTHTLDSDQNTFNSSNVSAPWSEFLFHFQHPHLISPLLSFSLRLHLYAWPYSGHWPPSSKGLIRVKLLTCSS